MTSVKEKLISSIEFLKAKGSKSAKLSAQEIIAHVLLKKPLDLYLYFDEAIKKEDLNTIDKYLQRRAKGEPFDYIKGEVDFYNCKITVTKDVLIPRQETEQLVGFIHKHLKSCDIKNKVLLDVATGSGCIGIVLKKIFSDMKVILSDFYDDALKIALINKEKNNVDVEIVKSDVLESFDDCEYDFLVSNPPYISFDEYKNLQDESLLFEPKQAFLGSHNGLEFYEKIAHQLKKKERKVKVFLEIGRDQGVEIQNIFFKFFGIKGQIHQDWSGNDRFFFLEIE